MNQWRRGGGLAAAFLIVVGALVLGSGTVTPAFGDKTPREDVAHALGANGYIKGTNGNHYSFSSDSEGVYCYPGSIQDPSNPTRTLTLYFTNPNSAQVACTAMADGGTMVITRPAAQTSTVPSSTPAPAVAPASAANPAATGRAVSRLADLLTELEENIKNASLNSVWDTASYEWFIVLALDPTPAEFTAALQELELSLKSSALDEDWDTRRVGWYTSLRQATTPAQFAELMKQLETAITWAAMENAWRERRNGWLADVSAAAAGSSNATPAASATPAPAVNRADTSAIARLAELLTSFENSVKPESIVSQWATERGPWISALQRAASVADLKAALQQFECSVKRATLVETWSSQRTAWYTALRAATTPAHVAVQLRQLEGSLKSEAMGRFWIMTQGIWRVNVDEVANGTYAPAAVPAPASPALANAPTAGGNLPKLAALLKELEAATMSQAQVGTWSGQRAAWQSAVAATTTLAQFREVLLEYEGSLTFIAVSVIYRVDDAWREEVRVASSVNRLAGLLKELEAVLTENAVTADWPGRRAAWAAEVTAAGTGGSAPPVPSPPARTIVAIDYEDTIAGHGNARYPDGTRYEGSFRDGVRHGYGVFYDANGAVAYEGYWGRDARLNSEPNHFKTGCGQFARGEYAGAIASLNRATVADLHHVEAYQKLVDAYVAVKDTQNARATLGRLRENNPRWSARNEVYFSMQELLITMDEEAQWV